MRGLRPASQRTMAAVAGRLRTGAAEDWFTALGTSMRPAIGAVQRVRLRPADPDERLRGRIVLVRVAGRWWLHRVVDERPEQVLVAGDNGMVNGWTPRAEVAGVLVAPAGPAGEAARGRPAP